jgi:hypothetical protein
LFSVTAFAQAELIRSGKNVGKRPYMLEISFDAAEISFDAVAKCVF